jgi:hypothetical protein
MVDEFIREMDGIAGFVDKAGFIDEKVRKELGNTLKTKT